MKLYLRERWRVFRYNLLQPWKERRFRHRLLPEWIAEGRDPERFPRFGKMDLDTYLWAQDCARQIKPDSARRPYSEWRQSLSARISSQASENK